MKSLIIYLMISLLAACGADDDTDHLESCQVELTLDEANSSVDLDRVSLLKLVGRGDESCRKLLWQTTTGGLGMEMTFDTLSVGKLTVGSFSLGERTFAVPAHLSTAKSGKVLSLRWSALSDSPDLDYVNEKTKTLEELSAEKTLRDSLRLPMEKTDTGDLTGAEDFALNLTTVGGTASGAKMELKAEN